MAEIIRLVCPECDAVHRVKSITLGKLYRCKKCKSGLITMSPAVLSCPSCGGTTPPAHIEVSRLITCEQCEEAPLLSVRFANIGTRQRSLHSLPSLEESKQSDESEPAKGQSAKITSQPEEELTSVFEPPLPEPKVSPANKKQREPDSHLTGYPDNDAVSPEEEDKQTNHAALKNDREDNEVSQPAHQIPNDASDAVSLEEQDFQDEPDIDDKNDTVFNVPETEPESRKLTDDDEITRGDLDSARRSAHSSKYDTAVLMSNEDFTQADLFEQPPLYKENDTTLNPAVNDDTDLPDDYRRQNIDDIGNEPLHTEPPAFRESAVEVGYHSSGEISELQLTIEEIVRRCQQPVVEEITRNRLRAPLWVTITLALLLVGLYGWLIGEMDTVRADLRAAKAKLEDNDALLDKRSEDFAKERKKLLDLLDQKELDKKKLERDLTEIMQKNEMLRKSMLGLPGPDLGID